MAGDDDLAKAIPEAPPPDGDRRRAAMEASLRRFDAQATEPDRAARTDAGERSFARKYAPVFASICLVAVLTVPVLLSNDWGFGLAERNAGGAVGEIVDRTTAVDISGETASSAPVQDPSRSERAAEPAIAAAPRVAQQPGPPATANSRSALQAFEASAGPDAAPPAFAVPAPPPPPPALASAPVGATAAEDSDAQTIVVTGGRVAAAPAREEAVTSRDRARADGRERVARNACTVLDRREDLRRCGTLADAAKPGSSGRAAARLADGLTLAWKGDNAGAVKAFDAAIAIAPDSANAYLNRGLVLQRRGEPERALADFTRAIEASPDDARAYYFRGLLLRARGEMARADRDFARVRELDGR